MQWLHRHTMEKNKNGGKKRKMVLQIKDIGKGYDSGLFCSLWPDYKKYVSPETWYIP